MNSVQLNNFYAYNAGSVSVHENTAQETKQEQQNTLKPLSDRFEKSGADSENISSYRFLTAELEKLRYIKTDAAGIPSPLLIKTTLETIEKQLENNETHLAGNPQLLVSLLKNITTLE